MTDLHHHHEEPSQFSVYSYALLQAAAQADIETVIECLGHQADTEVTDSEDRTPLMLACAQKYRHAPAVIKLLIEHQANVSHRDNRNNTCAHLAAAAGNLAALTLLKAAHAPLDDCNMDLRTPLHLSINPQATAFLIREGARCYLEDKAGCLPIFTATQQGNVENVVVHLQHGGKPFSRNREGLSAAAVAWHRQDLDLLNAMHKYTTLPGAQAEGLADLDFENWLLRALAGTPYELHRTSVSATALEVAPVVPGPNVVTFRQEEKAYPYFEMDALEALRKQPTDEDQKRFLQKMAERGNMRVLKHVPDKLDLSVLHEKFPNFDAVTTFLEEQVTLCRLSPQKIASFQPLMMLGEPGVGKTRYMVEVSRLLNLEFSLVQCGGVSANFVISGSTTSWKNGKPGKIHTTLRDGYTLNPIVMLDEIDKLKGSEDYDPHGPLYQLLENRTARMFQDECVEVPMDCSHFIWIATANYIDQIPEAILSRLVVVDVPKPEGDQLAQVARSVYLDILADAKDKGTWGSLFSPELDPAVIKALGDKTPREMRKTLLAACGKAAIRVAKATRGTPSAATLCLTVEDMDALPQHTDNKPAFGFIHHEKAA